MNIQAILGTSGDSVSVDTDRLVWRPGYPTHDGATWLQWSHWSRHWDASQEVRLASVHCAIVRDSVSRLVADEPGKCHYEHITALYDSVAGKGDMHHPYVAWRMVRESDGIVVYDSLTRAVAYWRVVRSGPPTLFGEVIQQLIRDGMIPGA